MEQDNKINPEWQEIIANHIKADMEEYIEDKITSVLARQLGKMLDFPLTVHQVAALTGRKEKAIYKMCEREILPYTKVGKSVYKNLRHLNSVLYRT